MPADAVPATADAAHVNTQLSFLSELGLPDLADALKRHPPLLWLVPYTHH